MRIKCMMNLMSQVSERKMYILVSVRDNWIITGNNIKLGPFHTRYQDKVQMGSRVEWKTSKTI